MTRDPTRHRRSIPSARRPSPPRPPRAIARAVAISVAIALSVAVASCATSAARREILRNNDRLFHAIAARDVTTLARLVTPDFHFETRDGHKGDRQTWLAAVAASPYVIESIRNDDLRLRLDGRRAMLCGVQRAVVIVDGKRVTDESPFCDRWEERDGHWLGAFAGVPPESGSGGAP